MSEIQKTFLALHVAVQHGVAALQAAASGYNGALPRKACARLSRVLARAAAGGSGSYATCFPGRFWPVLGRIAGLACPRRVGLEKGSRTWSAE